MSIKSGKSSFHGTLNGSSMKSELRVQNKSYRTEKTYLYWVGDFSFWIKLKPPMELSEEDVRSYLTYLSVHRNISFSTQKKGNKDRMTVLSRNLIPELQKQISRTRLLYEEDRRENRPGVPLPFALDQKYPNADKEWGWIFPSYMTSGRSRNFSAIRMSVRR